MIYKIITSILFVIYTSFTFAATPPKAESIFPIQARQIDPNMFEIHWSIQSGFFLYKDRIHIRPNSSDFFQLGGWTLPKAEIKVDKLGHQQSIYRQSLTLKIPILGIAPGESQINISYQGCSDAGYCYPPQMQTYIVQIGKNHALMSITPTYTSNESLASVKSAAETKFSTLFSKHSIWFVIMSFFGFGLLLAFTPCILPMIPVLSGIILNQTEVNTRRALLLSLSYVIGLSLTYALLGAGIALMGQNLQLMFQSSWTIAGLAILFTLLALSMFDLFELRIPVIWQQRLATLSRGNLGGSYLSAGIMGCLSILILSPCVTPPLVGALAYVADSGNVLVGATALFFLGFGSGVPLILLSISATHYIPKAGHWMIAVKSFFGLLLLGVAIHLLSTILAASVIMALWGALILSIGIFIGALIPAYSPLEKVRQSIGILFVLVGILILIGASMGNTNPLQPLQHKSHIALDKKESKIVTTLSLLQEALAQAADQLVVIDFYADWCTSCRIMAATTLQDPSVISALQGVKMITVDVTKNNKDSQTLLQHFQVIGPPTYIFINRNGQEEKQLRETGEMSAKVFLEHLRILEKS